MTHPDLDNASAGMDPTAKDARRAMIAQKVEARNKAQAALQARVEHQEKAERLDRIFSAE